MHRSTLQIRYLQGFCNQLFRLSWRGTLQKLNHSFAHSRLLFVHFNYSHIQLQSSKKAAKSPADAEWTNDLHLEFWAFVYGEHVGLSKCSIVLLLQMSIINYSSYLQTTLWSNFVAHHLTPTPSLFKCPSFKILDSGNKIQNMAKKRIWAYNKVVLTFEV